MERLDLGICLRLGGVIDVRKSHMLLIPWCFNDTVQLINVALPHAPGNQRRSYSSFTIAHLIISFSTFSSSGFYYHAINIRHQSPIATYRPARDERSAVQPPNPPKLAIRAALTAPKIDALASRARVKRWLLSGNTSAMSLRSRLRTTGCRTRR